ncbi:MAG: dynamin family protein [Kiritimatiellia bacterium]|jgi:hypothetical protein
MHGTANKAGTQKTPVAVVAGAFQNGKSTLVNCLLDGNYARMGQGCRTTVCCTRFVYGEAEEARLFRGLDDASGTVLERREDIFAPSFKVSGEDCIEIACWKPMLKRVGLIDTPGFDATTEDDATAKRALAEADIVLIVHGAKGLDEPTRRLAQEVFQSGKKAFFLCNCMTFDNWSPADKANVDICESIAAELDSMGVSSMLVPIENRLAWPCNPLWAWYAMGHLQRGLDSASKEEQDDARAAVRRIQGYWSEEHPTIDKRAILEASGILPVRRALEDIAGSLSDAFCQDPGKDVKALASAWMRRIRHVASGNAMDV